MTAGGTARGSSNAGRLQPGPTGAGGRGRSPLRTPLDRAAVTAVYRALLAEHGPQQWWPHRGEDEEQRAFEICAGAILTQNTAWRGAARALERLRDAEAFDCATLLALPTDVLADLIRPSGHFNLKAGRLQEFARTVVEEHGGTVLHLLSGEPEAVRERLLAIRGVGPETADAMLLYAARLPTFVVDAYCYRLFERLGLAPGERRYEVYRGFFMELIGPHVERLNEWHALIVRHGQQLCVRTRPRCHECVLLDGCPFGRDEAAG